jgi:hypothetical protein
VFCPLYTQKVFNQLPEEQMPEIVTEGASSIFLDIVQSCSESNPDGVFRVEEIDMLDPPPVDALASSLQQAIVFGYVRPVAKDDVTIGHQLTPLGDIASRFHRLTMQQSQTILSGYMWGVSIQDLALVVALYGARDIMLLARPDLDKSRKMALRAGLPASQGKHAMRDDFLEAVLMFGAFVKVLESTRGNLGALLDWCDANGFDFDGVVSLAGLREGVVSELIGAGLNPFWGSEWRLGETGPGEFDGTVKRLKMCIYAGLRFSTVKLGGGNKYRGVDGRVVTVATRKGEPPPERLVTNTVRIRAAPRSSRDRNPPLMYRLVPGLISVLDGYVPEDHSLMAPVGAEGRVGS